MFAPGIFSAANGFEGNFTTTPALDLRKPEVFAHFKNRLRDGYVKRGMRGFKIDRGEQGEMPAALQNELAILTAKAAYDATSDVLGAEGFTFARNAYDRARKYVAVWNGDSNATLAGHVRFAETAPAARPDHVLDGRVRHRRLRPQSERRDVCAMARAQRATRR